MQRGLVDCYSVRIKYGLVGTDAAERCGLCGGITLGGQIDVDAVFFKS
jgi:hypothetical protein